MGKGRVIGWGEKAVSRVQSNTNVMLIVEYPLTYGNVYVSMSISMIEYFTSFTIGTSSEKGV